MAILLLITLFGFAQTYSAEDYVKVGVAQARQGLFADAVRSAEKALTLKPDSLPAMSLAGKCYIQTGNYDRGIEMLHRILPVGNWSAEDHYFAGFAYYKLRRMDAAQQQFEIAVSLAPDSPAAYVYLGDVYVQIGNVDAGIKIMGKYLDRFPKDPNRAAVEKILAKMRQ